MRNEGWVCPKCGRVYAPFVMSCQPCGKNATGTLGGGGYFNVSRICGGVTTNTGFCSRCGHLSESTSGKCTRLVDV